MYLFVKKVFFVKNGSFHEKFVFFVTNSAFLKNGIFHEKQVYKLNYLTKTHTNFQILEDLKELTLKVMKNRKF